MTTPAIARQAEDIRRRLAALGTADEIDIYDLEYTAWEGSLTLTVTIPGGRACVMSLGESFV